MYFIFFSSTKTNIGDRLNKNNNYTLFDIN